VLPALLGPAWPRLRSIWPALLALALVALPALSGCRSRDMAPELLGLLDIGPRSATAGDSLDIVGTNLPPRKVARVTLTGTLLRPGQDPEEGVEFEVEGSVNGTRVEVPVDDALVARVCGKPEAALHTTFRGSVQVSFPASTPGALPITGSLHDVVLDIRPPSPRKARRDAQLEEAERVLALVGLRVADEAAAGGLAVTDVATDSGSEQAGIKKGDTLVSLDGWTVLDKTDIIPSGRRRAAQLGVLRPGEPRPIELEVALKGYKPRGSTDLLWVAVLLGTAACGILFFASPLARSLGWLDRFAARAAVAHAGRRNILVWLLTCLWAFWKGDASHPGGDVLPYVVFLAASGLCSLIPFSKQVVGIELDAGTALLFPVLLGAVVAIAQGEHPTKRRWSPLRGLRLSAWTLLYHVPSSIAVGCVLVLSGSIQLTEIVRAQGGEPWHWNALRTPAGLLMLLLFFAPVLLDRSPPPSRLPDAEPSALANLAGRNARGGFSSALTWGSLFVLCGVGAALFAGGWALPLIERSTQEKSFALQAAGALLFLVKTWTLALGVAVARETLPRVRIDQTGSPFLGWLLPGSLLVSALTAGWIFWDPAPLLRRVIAMVGTFLFALLAVHVSRRLAGAVRAAGAQSHVSPFL
jgi:NADH-quinone oxidoreductase subunit H